MAKMSRDKGKRGEREVVKLFNDHGYAARRGQQFKGTPDSPDVVHDLPWPLHVEVKYVERFSLYDALEQADADTDDKTPIVLHRRNEKPWVVVLEAEHFLAMMDYIRSLEIMTRS